MIMAVQMRRWVGVVLLAACFAGGSVAPAWSQETADKDKVFSVYDLQRLEKTFEHLAEHVRPSVVAIETRQVLNADAGRTIPNSQGSGFIIRSDGYIATNHHVVEGADQIIITLSDGTRHDAEMVEFDPRADLAVVKIDATNLRVAPMGDLSEVRVGQWCFTVGSPFGVANGTGNTSVSFGGVAALGRSLTDYIPSTGNDRFYGNLIETDASINPGNSGGPLFDLNGRVIGVNTAMRSGSGVNEGLGYAVPISQRTRMILNTLADGHVVRYGFLGVRIADADRRFVIGAGVHDGMGAIIDSLTGDSDSSPAARAGLMPNDVITEFAGEPVTNRDDLIRVVGATPVGSEVTVVYYRDKRQQIAKVTLNERFETAAARARAGGKSDARKSMVWRDVLLVEATQQFLETRTGSTASAGLYVADVPRKSALYRRGLRENDLIVSVDGTRVRTLNDLVQLEKSARDRLRLELDDRSTVTVPK